MIGKGIEKEIEIGKEIEIDSYSKIDKGTGRKIEDQAIRKNLLQKVSEPQKRILLE